MESHGGVRLIGCPENKLFMDVGNGSNAARISDHSVPLFSQFFQQLSLFRRFIPKPSTSAAGLPKRRSGQCETILVPSIRGNEPLNMIQPPVFTWRHSHADPETP